MIRAYPKIFALDTRYVKDIFCGPVEITEKVDGSQFSFGKTLDGEFFVRSRKQQLFPEHPTKIFAEGVAYADSIQYKVPNGYTFYCEYLQKPKHNTLAYDRIPKNHLALFAIRKEDGEFINNHQFLGIFAGDMGIDIVPLIGVEDYSERESDILTILDKLLETESYLGGAKIEGVVIKNYEKDVLMNDGTPISDGVMAGKLVSEKFKECNHKSHRGSSNKSRLEVLTESYCTEARWEKAVQHLRDEDRLLFEPKDIGILIKEIERDLFEEETENIKNYLFAILKDQFKRAAIKGFPEWYKKWLITTSEGRDEQ